MGIHKQFWETVVQERLKEDAMFLAGVKNLDDKVDANNTLNLAAAGVQPSVYVNNTTWPMTNSQITDSNNAVALDTFSSEPTSIAEAERQQYSYDKVASDTDGHTLALNEKFFLKAVHNFSPTANGANVPVIATTGAADGAFKRFAVKQITTLQKRWNLIKLPQVGRNLVLNPVHFEHLLEDNVTLANQFVNIKEGQPLRAFGFNIYTFSTEVYYTQAGSRVAFAATPGGTDGVASVAFIDSQTFKAEGTLKSFINEGDPNYQATIMSFQRRAIAGPIRSNGQGIAAIYSATV